MGAEEKLKREEKKRELMQEAMEEPEFDEATFIAAFDADFPEEESSVDFDELQTMLGDEALLEVRGTEKHEQVKKAKMHDPPAAKCEPQKCCKCKAPVPPEVEIGWSKMEEDPKWVVVWSCRGQCTLCKEDRKKEAQKRGYKGLGYGLDSTFQPPSVLENDGSGHRICQEHFEAEEKLKREEKKRELMQEAMEEPEFDEATFIAAFDADFPEEESSVDFDELQTMLGDEALLEVRGTEKHEQVKKTKMHDPPAAKCEPQ